MNINDLMNWTPDKQVLSQETPLITHNHVLTYNRDHNYSIERELTEEEKVAIFGKLDDKLIKVLSLADQFQREKDTIKKDKKGGLNIASYRAWLKRNDNGEIDCEYRLGRVRFYQISYDHGYYISSLGEPDKRSEFIKNEFHKLLSQLRKKEYQYYLDHDEYTILKRKLEKSEYTFGVHIGFCSNGRVLVYDNDTNAERDITIDELKTLLAMNKQVDDFVAELAAKCDIKY